MNLKGMKSHEATVVFTSTSSLQLIRAVNEIASSLALNRGGEKPPLAAF